MEQKKKRYEKPALEPVKMLEVGAALCCRATIATCSNATRTGRGKTQRTLDSS